MSEMQIVQVSGGGSVGKHPLVIEAGQRAVEEFVHMMNDECSWEQMERVRKEAEDRKLKELLNGV